MVMDLCERVAIWGLVLALLAAIGWFAYTLDDITNRRLHPSSYEDTMSVILPSIQGAKTSAMEANDKERYEFWSKFESDLMDKVMGEKAGK